MFCLLLLYTEYSDCNCNIMASDLTKNKCDILGLYLEFRSANTAGELQHINLLYEHG